MNQLKIADRNIKLYIFIKVFAKRVFLPLSAIYFMDYAGFSIRNIGVLASFYAIVQLVAEVPTGYFADKVGRLVSIRVGSFLLALGTIFYVIFHNKTGVFAGVFLEALGYSFLGGAGEALIHDSLIVKKQEHEYTKVLSRAQSISLIVNAILLAVVPMSYAINPSYPFLIGTFAYLSLFTASLFMHDVAKSTSIVKQKFLDIRKVTGKRNILLFGITFGIISALFTAPLDMNNLALKEFGINPSYIGWVYSLSSVFGALLGPFIHYLRRIKLSSYLLIDLFTLLNVYFAAYTRSALFFASSMIVAIGFWRYRRIIYQSYLLTLYPTEYKATLISTMNNLEQLNSVWLPLLITFAVAHTSTSNGLGLTGLFTLAIAPIYYFSTLKFFSRNPVPTTLPNTPSDIV
jgi:MFS family permease